MVPDDSPKFLEADLAEAHLMMKALSTYRFYPFHQHPHPPFTETERALDDLVHERLTDFGCQYIADGTTQGGRIMLTGAQAKHIFKAIKGCYEEMHDCPADLHIMLRLQSPHPLLALADRLKAFIRSFGVASDG